MKIMSALNYNITFVSDKSNWINGSLLEFINYIKSLGHQVKHVYDIKTVPAGDLAFYLGCEQIVPRSVLLRNKNNLIVHASDLPKGKGWSPMSWQILEGANQITVTLLEAAEKVDSGVIYAKGTVQFRGDELIDELRQKLGEVCLQLCLMFINEYPNILNKALPQTGESTYYLKRTPGDSELDVNKTLYEQFNLLRIVDNEKYPAYFRLYGHIYKLSIEKVSK